ncbi:BUD32 protein kinase [Vittaforma corneae ATCC 50505]|uniref:non-specific serine/threonine protein kinase n=1 Tax=Vittaforma corneae (strain ATCC 50505) TaxID=993615 RepID=L2GQ60_VITCO|nr:BUD32 protein kinase [Vittaforma corneae ATCC 50505]ELA42615.1 BUD32 protein kinase [Vittaforma corneae ATCC 50505]
MKIVAQGAEAILYEEDSIIIKERPSKKYRIPEIDSKLIKSRTKKEAKILDMLLNKGLSVPKLIKVEENKIFMEKIAGETLKTVLNDQNYCFLMRIAGEMIAKMHKLDVVHGDLTTLNFIFNGNLFLIDFGLGFSSTKDEDKAVDLYVFERSIKCGHSENYLEPFYEAYSITGSVSILKKLESVRLRGRKREENILM